MSNDDEPTTESSLPRFQVFASSRKGVNYVLRDNEAGTDYPFKTRKTAVAAIERRRSPKFADGLVFGSAANVDAYMTSGPALDEAAA